jgi:hypothetical protein
MNGHIRSRDQKERNAYLDDLEKTHFFDVDSGIYKPNSAKQKPEKETPDPGSGPSTPLFTNHGTDYSALTVAIISALISAITLLIIGIYTYYAGGQWREMQRTAQAATDANRIANSALKQSIRTNIQQERPWIFLDKGREVWDTSSNSPTVKIRMVNWGKLPARNVEGKTVVRVVSLNEPLHFIYGENPYSYSSGGIGLLLPGFDSDEIIIGPSQFVEPGHTLESRQLTTTEWSMLKNQQGYLVMYGEFTYNDPSGISHWTHVCVYGMPKGMQMRGQFKACAHYNNTDDNYEPSKSPVPAK